MTIWYTINRGKTDGPMYPVRVRVIECAIESGINWKCGRVCFPGDIPEKTISENLIFWLFLLDLEEILTLNENDPVASSQGCKTFLQLFLRNLATVSLFA